MSDKKFSRRDLLKIGTTGALGVAGSFYLNKAASFPQMVHADTHTPNKQSHIVNHTLMNDSAKTDGYKMAERLLTEFDYGKVTKLSNGQTLREYKIVAVDKEIEIAKGIKFP